LKKHKENRHGYQSRFYHPNSSSTEIPQQSKSACKEIPVLLLSVAIWTAYCFSLYLASPPIFCNRNTDPFAMILSLFTGIRRNNSNIVSLNTIDYNTVSNAAEICKIAARVDWC
jgi:hypothetical protein